MSAREMSLTTSASRPLAASLPRAVLRPPRRRARRRSRRASGPRGARAASPASTSAVGSSASSRSLAAGLLDLARPRAAAGVKSATAAAISSTSQAGNSCSHACLQLGGGADVAARAPRRAPAARRWRRPASPRRRGARPACASARPMRPEELLPTKRTLSIGSRVPPAVTSTRTPASELPPARPRARRPGERRLAGRQQLGRLGQAPDALLARARPAARCRARRSRTPRSRSVSQVGLRGRVLVHVVVHRRRDEQRAVRRPARSCVSRLSARPPASLAIVLAEAGRDQVDVGVGDQLQVAERLVRRAAAGRGTRRAPGRARTR